MEWAIISGCCQSFLFIFRCCKKSTSPFTATDPHSYLMLFVSLDFSLVFILGAAGIQRVHRKVEDRARSESLLRGLF